MAKMNELDLMTLIDAMEQDAVVNQNAFISDNEYLLRRYQREPYGTEVPGRSQVVSNGVQDTVESDMPSLVRAFLGSSEIFKFSPNSNNPKDVQEAEEKTLYVDWLIRKQANSFRVHHGFLKDVCIQKMGVLKYFFEETEKTEEHPYKNISMIELEEIIDSLAVGDGEREIDIVSRGEVNEEGEFDITFKVKVKRQEVKIIGIPIESFLLSQNATDIDDASLVGDTVAKTRGMLLAEGHSKDLIDRMPQSYNNGSIDGSTMKQIRFSDEGGLDDGSFSNWANEWVQISDLYVMVDYDGDGIPERRHIQKSGDVILVNEAFDHVPYAMASGILMPHKAIGKSRAEIAAPFAEIDTALQRQMLDNGYIHNNPKMGVNEQVNLDDLLNDSIGGVARVKGKDNPGQHIFPMQVPFIGDKTMLLMQHISALKAESLGSTMSSQGLNVDQINNETATRFEGVRDAAQGKIELVARVIAEVGYRKLYEGIAWMVSHYQTTEREFMVLGKELRTNPANWKYEHIVNSEIGLGAGDNEKIVENMTGIWSIQQSLKQQGSQLVDEVKEFNTLNKLTKALEIKEVSSYFNDPSQPDELLVAENEALSKMVAQMQQQLEQMQNPLAEAETIKQQAFLAKAQSDAQMGVAKLTQDQEQFNETMRQNQQKIDSQLKKQDEDFIAKLTELELKYSKDVPGAIV